jgi:hypothetical protein
MPRRAASTPDGRHPGAGVPACAGSLQCGHRQHDGVEGAGPCRQANRIEAARSSLVGTPGAFELSGRPLLLVKGVTVSMARSAAVGRECRLGAANSAAPRSVSGRPVGSV